MKLSSFLLTTGLLSAAGICAAQTEITLPGTRIFPESITSTKDGTLYYGAVQTMPFARPQFQDLLGAVDFAIAKNYPARGEYTGEV